MGYPPDMMHAGGGGGYHGMRETDMHRMVDMGRGMGMGPPPGPPGGMGGGYDPYGGGPGFGRPAGCFKCVLLMYPLLPGWSVHLTSPGVVQLATLLASVLGETRKRATSAASRCANHTN